MHAGDVLEWITWGGGGLGDPLDRPAAIVAQEVHRRLVTFEGASSNYGVVVRPSDFSVDEQATEDLRHKLRLQMEAKPMENMAINRGGTISELIAACKRETGLKPPRPQWEVNPYGPHAGLPYVKGWYAKMKRNGMKIFDEA